jgi:hypothetical protein
MRPHKAQLRELPTLNNICALAFSIETRRTNLRRISQAKRLRVRRTPQKGQPSGSAIVRALPRRFPTAGYGFCTSICPEERQAFHPLLAVCSIFSRGFDSEMSEKHSLNIKHNNLHDLACNCSLNLAKRELTKEVPVKAHQEGSLLSIASFFFSPIVSSLHRRDNGGLDRGCRDL